MWGENHSATLGLRMARIEIQQSLSADDIADSLQELNDLIPRLRQFYQPNHPLVAKMMLFQSGANQALGHLPEAEQQAREALDIAQTSLGEDHPLTGRIYMAVARNLLAQGKPDQALDYSRSSVDSYRRFYGENHSETLQQKTSLAAILLQQKHYEEARQMATDIYRQQAKTLGDQHRASQYAQMVLARAYVGLKDFQEAEKQAENCYQNARKVNETNMLVVGCGLVLEQSLFEQQQWPRAKQLATKLLNNPIVANHPVYAKQLEEHLSTINQLD
jgi:hypothetical protein